VAEQESMRLLVGGWGCVTAHMGGCGSTGVCVDRQGKAMEATDQHRDQGVEKRRAGTGNLSLCVLAQAGMTKGGKGAGSDGCASTRVAGGGARRFDARHVFAAHSASVHCHTLPSAASQHTCFPC
jgi:hypothetical protein